MQAKFDRSGLGQKQFALLRHEVTRAAQRLSRTQMLDLADDLHQEVRTFRERAHLWADRGSSR